MWEEKLSIIARAIQPRVSADAAARSKERSTWAPAWGHPMQSVCPSSCHPFDQTVIKPPFDKDGDHLRCMAACW